MVSKNQKRLLQSEHCTERKKTIRHLVVHSFAFSVDEMLPLLDKLGMSTHYIIDTSGRVIQLVPEDKVAWHAGKSFWRGGTGLNATSIGIELQNNTLGQEPFSDIQLKSFKELAQDLVKRYQIDARNVVAHSDIAPTRKVDVGKAFPWQDMAKVGIGIWPAQSSILKGKEEDVASLLATIGYDTSDVGKALLAFERHFMPELVPTDMDIMHLEENLKKVQPVNTPAVRRRLAEVAQAFR